MSNHGEIHSEVEVRITYDYHPGTPEYIPSRDRPEDYDPGSAPDIFNLLMYVGKHTVEIDEDAWPTLREEILDDIAAQD